MRVLPCGTTAALVELDRLDDVLALHHLVTRLRESAVPAWREVTELVPAARTLLVAVASPDHLSGVLDALRALPAPPPLSPGQGEAISIDVVYDGEDLGHVAEATGLDVAEVIRAHTSRPWRVAFGGFAPGFAYLSDGDPHLAVARRPSPRTRVPSGSVGLAGEFSGIYPRASPGGWQLIGHTRAVMWDERRARPALLEPGMLVQFRAVP